VNGIHCTRFSYILQNYPMDRAGDPIASGGPIGILADINYRGDVLIKEKATRMSAPKCIRASPSDRYRFAKDPVRAIGDAIRETCMQKGGRSIAHAIFPS